MPEFESEKQKRLMYAAAHDPEIAKRKGVPQSVAKEFIGESDSNIHHYMEACAKGDSDMIESSRRKLADGY